VNQKKQICVEKSRSGNSAWSHAEKRLVQQLEVNV